MQLFELFYKGGVFMWPILLSFIVAFAFSIYKAIILFKSTINSKQLIQHTKLNLDENNMTALRNACKKTKGPIASIICSAVDAIAYSDSYIRYQIQAVGELEMSFLEKGMILLSGTIVLAPMLGFTGTVFGMIEAFQSIAEADEISAAVVASGIEKALITTLFGLVVAMILQFFYNSFVAKIDSMIQDMELSALEIYNMIYKRKESK